MQAIVFTKEGIREEIRKANEWIINHKNKHPDWETHVVWNGQLRYAENTLSYYTSLLCNFGYTSSNIEIVEEPKLPVYGV